MDDEHWPADRDCDITITISGVFGSGKTTLSQFILRKLKEEGLTVSIQDPDDPLDDESVEWCMSRLVGRAQSQPYPVVKIQTVQERK